MRRGVTPSRAHEEEEESVFVSMTDMTVSFLFILLVLLAFFASQFNKDDIVSKDLYVQERSLRIAAEARLEELLEEREQLELRLKQVAQERDDLQVKLKAAEAQIAELQTQVTVLRNEAEDYRSRIFELKESLEKLERALEDKTREIEAQKVEIARLRELLRVRNPLEEYLSAVEAERAKLLVRLQQQIQQDFPELEVRISAENDALRFQGEGLFGSGSAFLVADKRRIIERIAERLDAVLPCYSLGPRTSWDASCNPGGAVIEAVQIEGHTDSDGPDQTNIQLSANRAVSTFGAMLAKVPGLISHQNFDGEPVLSVAGYGETRPIADNQTREGKSANRRIDLRFIMFTPAESDAINLIRERLASGAEND